MFGKYLPLLLILMTLLLVSCADPKYVTIIDAAGGSSEQKLSTCQARFTSGYCAAISWEKKPAGDKFGSFLFKIFRPNAGDGSPIEVDLNGTLAVELWMPSMGHGSSPVRVERLDIGTYRASKVYFTMSGEWEIRIQLKEQNESKDQAIIPITL